jgi:hypothetical protein
MFKIISEPINIKERTVIVVNMHGYNQAFYKRTGYGGESIDCKKGQWAPFFGVFAGWFVKAKGEEDPGCHRYVTKELKEVCLWLDEQDIDIGEKTDIRECNEWLYSFSIQGLCSDYRKIKSLGFVVYNPITVDMIKSGELIGGKKNEV